jgi:hypothetical protein
VGLLYLMGQPLEQRYAKVPVQERVAQLRRDAARLRWEADLLRNVSGAPAFLHQVSLLRRKAYAADAKADRVMREAYSPAPSPEMSNDIKDLGRAVRK